ncbi:MAG: undecaprenyl/decaprenyl-phosphate alpha-N-acetylglucosaminyl 1-phosphate transferase, partial [Candidatus Omnitrophota bacterium]
MTTLLFLFLIALGFSLVLTPVAKRLGVRLGAVDVPSARKVHATAIPRIGGLAVFLAFTATITLT